MSAFFKTAIPSGPILVTALLEAPHMIFRYTILYVDDVSSSLDFFKGLSGSNAASFTKATITASW